MEIDREILKKINSLPNPMLIAISGFGGSGKSTAAEKLGAYLDAPVIGVDSFARHRLSGGTAWNSVDFGRLEREVLKPFEAGQNPLVYGHYDWSSNGIVTTAPVEHRGRLIVEGVGLFRPELYQYFSYMLWIDCPLEEAAARGKKRDREIHNNPQDERWDGVWKRNDLEYLAAYKPDEMANAVIKNEKIDLT
ncbi:MAG: hypothetical protein WDN10_01035 [bacterium]